MSDTTERTCETCGHNGKPSCDKGYCLRGTGMWEPRPAAQEAEELKPCKKAFDNFENLSYSELEESSNFANSICDWNTDTDRWNRAMSFHFAWNRRPSLPMSAEIPVDLYPSIDGIFNAEDKGEERTEWEKGFAAGVIKAKSFPMSAEVERAVERVRKHLISIIGGKVTWAGAGYQGPYCLSDAKHDAQQAMTDLDLIVAALKARGC